MPEEFRKDHVTFWNFVLRNKTNRNYLLIASIAVVIQFIVFKVLYPYADYFSDSYSYLYGAQANLSINIWPIGYSWFLRYVHFVTSSDTAVVGIQYFFLIISSLVFFFTIRYFYTPTRSSSNILYAFLFFNPLYLYISNYINSDPLFAALSLLWLTQLLWIVHRPMIYQVITHGLLLYLCFIVRNNAMIYPFISIFAFLLSNHRKFVKVFGIAFGSLLVILFVNHQRNAAYRLVGQEEFSLFTGWQLANNALYMYAHLDVDTTRFQTKEAAELDRYAKAFYYNKPKFFDRMLTAYTANYFIREPKAPLKTYFSDHFKPRTEDDVIYDWARANIVFKEWGTQLIKDHPVAFYKHFMKRNTPNYFIPPLEKLEVYNLKMDEVRSIAASWFGYDSKKVTSVSNTVQGKILYIYPIIFLFLNVCYIGAGLWYLVRGHFKSKSVTINRGHLIIAAYFLGNMAFSIFATINVFRYQFFPMLVMLAFSLLFIETVDEREKTLHKLRVIKKFRQKEASNSHVPII